MTRRADSGGRPCATESLSNSCSIPPWQCADLGLSVHGLAGVRLRGELDRVKELVQPQTGIEVWDAA